MLHHIKTLFFFFFDGMRKTFGINPLIFSLNFLITCFLFAYLAAVLIPNLLNWFFFEANFSAISAKECKNSGGACWAFIIEKYRFILFGMYPYTEQWRPFLATMILTILIAISGFRNFWSSILPIIWILGVTSVACLMWGGIFGLFYVENTFWGGLPLTLILSIMGILFAFPLGIFLALGRCSKMPAISFLSIIYIELVRGIPLVSLLFISSIIFPFLFPESFCFDKLLRAQVAIIIFAAAYIAETIRGGLQAIPAGQYDGASSLGLNYWQRMFKVILPQAMQMVISPLISIFISIFKDTSLVVVIGIFDLTLSAKSALSDPQWYGLGLETYIFISLIYFLYCYLISRFGRAIEKNFRKANFQKEMINHAK